MADSYANSPFPRSSAPTGLLLAATASGTAFINGPCRGIYLGVSGDVTITCMNDSSVTLVGLAAGVIHPIQAKKITALDNGAASCLIAY